MNAFEVKNLHKSFGSNHALNDVSFSVKEGEIFGFLGPNGAGKSTTIRCLMDFISPDSGQVTILGLDAHKDGVELKRQIGYVPAELNLYPNWTVDAHIKFVAKMRKISPDTALPLLKKLEVPVKAKIRHLSTGNQQKLAIVLALMGDPKLLILDEPTRGLDPLLQASFHELLREYRDNGGTIFLSSHNLPEVEELCTNVAVIRAGKLITSTGLKELKANSTYSFHVVFSKEVPDLSKLKLDQLKVTGKTAVFSLKGDINPILRQLSRYEVSDLAISRASLEELFIGMYQE